MIPSPNFKLFKLVILQFSQVNPAVLGKLIYTPSILLLEIFKLFRSNPFTVEISKLLFLASKSVNLLIEFIPFMPLRLLATKDANSVLLKAETSVTLVFDISKLDMFFIPDNGVISLTSVFDINNSFRLDIFSIPARFDTFVLDIFSEYNSLSLVISLISLILVLFNFNLPKLLNLDKYFKSSLVTSVFDKSTSLTFDNATSVTYSFPSFLITL